MTPATIDRNLKRFLAMEVYEVIPSPLYGLKPEYLGKDYFDLYRHACRRCREWGIKLWIYDEFNWPSGTCAGRVLREKKIIPKMIDRIKELFLVNDDNRDA